MKIFLCAISNISSGSCSEDCAFCTQSAHYKANIEIYKEKPVKKIVDEAKRARENRAVGFCLVTSGKELDESRLRFVCKSAEAVKKAVPDLHLIACNGIATKERLLVLKDSGIDSYNHNLESSRAYYEKICTTHDWDARYQTCLDVKEVGLELCSGGIWGMGESEEDRYALLNSIKELEPSSVAMNFYHPNPALPLEKNISPKEALFWISKMRESLPESMVMVAGGREVTFGENQADIFKAGANAIVIGDYLTTKGQEANKDILMLESLGFEVVQKCHEQ